MMRCGNCAFWEMGEQTWGWCQLGKSVAGQPKNDYTLAYGLDSEAYSAGLRTQIEFGCVQFKHKDAPPPQKPLYDPAAYQQLLRKTVPDETIVPPTFIYRSENGLPLTKEQIEHNRKHGL